MKIIFLVGLPGSGKTFLGNQLKEKYNAIFIDDISKNGGLKQSLKLIGSEVSIISDPWLCFTKNRTFASKFFGNECEMEWIYFQNDPEQCWKNIQNRDERIISRHTIDFFSKDYVIPEDSTIIEVWK